MSITRSFEVKKDLWKMGDIDLEVGPTGRLRLAGRADVGSELINESLAGRLREALSASNAAGLVELVSPDWPLELPATLAWWRDWARNFFQRVCRVEEIPGKSWGDLPPPTDEELMAFVMSAPPMVGLEFVSIPLLTQSWQELCSHASNTAAVDREGPIGWLRRVNPLGHLVGKVTFHMAENPRDTARPFAFLATFAHKLSENAKPRHRPLAEALKESVANRDVGALERLLEPVRNAAAHSSLVAELLRTKRLFAPQAWTADEAYRFLQQSPMMEAAGVVIRLPDWWSTRRPSRPEVRVRVGDKTPSKLGYAGLLDFHVDVVLAGEPISASELESLMSGSAGLRLLRGKWVEVDQSKLQEAIEHWQRMTVRHPDGVSLIEGMRLLAGTPITSMALSADEPTAEWSSISSGEWLRSTLERMRRSDSGPSEQGGCQPGRDLQAVLRPYQIEGVHRLWFMMELGLGACLADDMGLGKTIQVLDLLLQRKRLAIQIRATPALLIVPSSLLGNWKSEATKFAPSLKVYFAHRSETDVADLEQRTHRPVAGFADYDLVVTTYGMVRRQPWLKEMTWSLIILDEAQAIKNAGSSQTKEIKQLKSSRRLVMTGTPIENHVGELWSLFDFSSPGLLGSATEFKKFVAKLNQRKDGQGYAGLRTLVSPYIIRRLKTDPEIAANLPEKVEVRAECGLSKTQAILYAQAVENLRQQLETVTGIQRRGLVLASLMQFKQICNHPAQYLGETDFPPDESGKFVRLAQLCEPIAARQEKALIFTQFQSICAPLAEFLKTVFGGPGFMLHGGTLIKQRTELVRQFQNEPTGSFFVISLKAGGSGLNLTAASHVVHFDRWWNPAVEDQATDRAFRIGQRHNVLVHKFVCRGTIEERIDEMISDKRQVAAQVLEGDGSPRLTEMSDDELLRFVALNLGRASDNDHVAYQEPQSPTRRRGRARD